MASTRGLMLIADIGGYTDYMRTHRMSLAHAEVNTGRLLEHRHRRGARAGAGRDRGRRRLPLPAGRLERSRRARRGGGPGRGGDAPGVPRRARVRRQRTCAPAVGARRPSNLTLKFVAHVGEVATQTIRDRLKLVGIDVILVHRLLKNPVPVREYVLLTEDLYGSGSPALPDTVARGRARPRRLRAGRGLLRRRGRPPAGTPRPAGGRAGAAGWAARRTPRVPACPTCSAARVGVRSPPRADAAVGAVREDARMECAE